LQKYANLDFNSIFTRICKFGIYIKCQKSHGEGNSLKGNGYVLEADPAQVNK
jgi:hypothetical protein